MPRWDPADQPEHNVRLETIDDMLDLTERALEAGVPPEVATKLPVFAAARQAGRETGLDRHTETRLRQALAELEEPAPPPRRPRPGSPAAGRAPTVKRRNPGYRNWPRDGRALSAAA